MGGLIFLLVVGLWLALCLYLAHHIPGWLRIKRFGWILSMLLFPLLVVSPVVDEVIGKQQFAKLCETHMYYESQDMFKAKRIRVDSPPYRRLSGYWIPIEGRTIKYIDDETNQVILSYDDFHTDGGRLLGSSHIFGMEKYCLSSRDQIEKMRHLEKLIQDGVKP